MKLRNKDYAKLSIINKIDKITKYARKYLMTHHELKDNFFIFDKLGKSYMIPIDNKKFVQIPEYKDLFNKLAKAIIKKVERENNTQIVNFLYIYNDIFDTTASDTLDLNISWKEDQARRDSMIVLNESLFETIVDVYDKISIIDNKRYTIISENPIKTININKLDIEWEIKGFLTNMIN